LVLVAFLCLASPVFAARKLSITGDKATLRGSDEMIITASLSGFTTGESIFIKGAFYKDGSTNYFGYTKSGDTWIKNSVKTSDQRLVVIGNWDNTVTVKSDYADSGFSGNGNYLLKIGFYTVASDGNPSSVDWSDSSFAVSLEQPAPTLTSVPTSYPSATPTRTPTSRPTDKLFSVVLPSQTNAVVLSENTMSDDTPAHDTPGDLLSEAASTESAEYLEQQEALVSTGSLSGQNAKEEIKNQRLGVLPFLYGGLVSGMLSLVALGYIFIRQRKAE
jgi:hypothetical protein